jgi:uncharacterized protein (TIGR02391 family)
MIKSFDDLTVRNISDVLSVILTHTKITEFLKAANIPEFAEGSNKTDRIFYALMAKQKNDGCANNILNLVQKVVHPKRYSDEVEFENNRSAINSKLLYEGLELDKFGAFQVVAKARTISEAKERSKKIKEKIHGIAIHPDIIKYCEQEALKENYFHAILEITKCIAQTFRDKSGYTSDGSDLVDDCLALGKEKKPMLAFNTLSDPSEESEHKGFANFVKGFFSMYRNPKAHNPKILEDTQLSDMTEVLVIASIILRKLDHTYKTGLK